MGKIRMILYRVSKMLPYKARKPIIAVSMTLGSYIFFEAMIRWTQSDYLMAFKSFILSAIDTLMNAGIHPMFFLLLFVAMLYLAYKNWQEFKALLSFLDLIILILAFLPFFLKE